MNRDQLLPWVRLGLLFSDRRLLQFQRIVFVFDHRLDILRMYRPFRLDRCPLGFFLPKNEKRELVSIGMN